MPKQKLRGEAGADVLTSQSQAGTRLREIADTFKSRELAAAAAGVSKSTLQRWLDGTTDPSFAGLARLASVAGFSLDWLATGADAAGGGQHGAGPDPESLGPGFVLVPRYDIAASAGPGALSDREQVIDHLAFQENWVRRTLRADPNKLVLITAVGDSMEPTIRAGDLLLVDTGVSELIDDAIYVLAFDDHLMVKRVQRFFSGAVTVKSDNQVSYVEQTLTPEEAANIRVAGRVRWIGRLI